MSKTKKSTTPPEIYKSLVMSKEFLTRCIAEDHHHAFFVFPTPQDCHLVAQGIHKKWANFEEFRKEGTQTMLAYHDELFKALPPKGQDLEITFMNTWFAMYAVATKRIPEAVPRTESGRKSTIGTRKYFLGEVKEGFADVVTSQAKACLTIVRDAVKESGEVTEENLKSLINQRASELKTRQDPWRIFQYYRPTLIKAKLIKHD